MAEILEVENLCYGLLKAGVFVVGSKPLLGHSQVKLGCDKYGFYLKHLKCCIKIPLLKT